LSPYQYARDCYRIEFVAADQIVSGESKNIAFAIWQQPEVVVLFNNNSSDSILLGRHQDSSSKWQLWYQS